MSPSNSLQLLIQTHLSTDDTSDLGQRIMSLVDILKGSRLLALAAVSGQPMGTWLDSISGLLVNRHRHIAILDLVRISAQQIPYQCLSVGSIWCEAINAWIKTSGSSVDELASMVVALGDVYRLTLGRPEVLREVTNIQLPQTVNLVLKSENIPTAVLESMREWCLLFPSIMRPFTDKLSSICVQMFEHYMDSDVLRVARLSVALCNTAGKQAVADKYGNLIGSLLVNASNVLDTVLSPIHEPACRSLGFKDPFLPVGSQKSSGDYIDNWPRQISFLSKVLEFIKVAMVQSGSLSSGPVSLPLSDLMSICSRVFRVSCVHALRRQHSDSDQFEYCLALLGRIQCMFTDFVGHIAQLVGRRLLRYRNVLIQMVSMWLNEQNMALRCSAFRTIGILCMNMDCTFFEKLEKELMGTLCRDVVVQLKTEGVISTVEQQGSSRKRKRKSNPAQLQPAQKPATSVSKEVINDSELQFEAVQLLSIIARRFSRHGTEAIFKGIDQIVIANIATAHSMCQSPLKSCFSEEFLLKCKEYVINRCRFSGGRQCGLLGFALNIDEWGATGSDGRSMLEPLLNPRVPLMLSKVDIYGGHLEGPITTESFLESVLGTGEDEENEEVMAVMVDAQVQCDSLPDPKRHAVHLERNATGSMPSQPSLPKVPPATSMHAMPAEPKPPQLEPHTLLKQKMPAPNHPLNQAVSVHREIPTAPPPKALESLSDDDDLEGIFIVDAPPDNQ